MSCFLLVFSESELFFALLLQFSGVFVRFSRFLVVYHRIFDVFGLLNFKNCDGYGKIPKFHRKFRRINFELCDMRGTHMADLKIRNIS